MLKGELRGVIAPTAEQFYSCFVTALRLGQFVGAEQIIPRSVKQRFALRTAPCTAHNKDF